MRPRRSPGCPAPISETRPSIAARLVAAALAGAGFDYLENAAVRDMLIGGTAGDLAIAASRWTVLKGLGFGLAIAGLALLLLRAGWRRVRG